MSDYTATRERVEHYFDRSATKVWDRLTSDAPVSRIRQTVREGRDRMRATMLSRLPADLRDSTEIRRIYLGGYIGLEYLYNQGHRDILWVSGPKHHHQSNQRFVGITQAAVEFGVELSVMSAPALDFITGEHMAPEIIAAGPLPDAIFAGNDAPHMDLIITVCDNAAGEICPYWPGKPATAHWGYADPSNVLGTDAERLEAFVQTMHLIAKRIRLLIALPSERLLPTNLSATAKELASQ